METTIKTHIIYDARLSPATANRYLELLIEKELLRQEGNSYIITDKGKVFREMARKLKL